jgi:hypothetical protein
MQISRYSNTMILLRKFATHRANLSAELHKSRSKDLETTQRKEGRPLCVTGFVHLPFHPWLIHKNPLIANYFSYLQSKTEVLVVSKSSKIVFEKADMYASRGTAVGFLSTLHQCSYSCKATFWRFPLKISSSVSTSS